MSRRRNVLWGIAAMAAGAAASVAAEEVLYRRIYRRPDPEGAEVIGSVPGETLWLPSFDGTPLNVRTYGSTDPQLTLVFAHGLVENLDIWHYQLRDLSSDARLRLVAYDARGHGASGPARGPEDQTAFTGDVLARDLAMVIASVTTGPVLVVGHSMGGMAAQALLTEDSPGRSQVLAAVITNSTFTAQLRGWRARGGVYERLLERIGDAGRLAAGDDAGRIERFRPRSGDLGKLATRWWFGDNPSPAHMAFTFEMFNQTPSHTIGAALDLVGFDVYAMLPRIDVPVLVVSGSKDRITPPWLSAEIAGGIASSELVVFDGCGHMTPFERHDELTAHIRKFAERVSA